MVVALAGATGLTGTHTLHLLLQHPQVSQVVAIGRRQTGASHSKLTEVMLQHGKLAQPVVADAFICCLGTTIKQAGSQAAFEAVDLDLPVYLGTQLHAQGCQRAAIVSAMLANADSRVFYNRTKGRMEQAMQAIGFESLYLLRPSFITGKRSQARLGEWLAYGLSFILRPILVGRWIHLRPIAASAIAQALVTSILHGQPGSHTYLSHHIKQLAKG